VPGQRPREPALTRRRNPSVLPAAEPELRRRRARSAL